MIKLEFLLEYTRHFYSIEKIRLMQLQGMTLQDILDSYEDWQQSMAEEEVDNLED